MLKGENLNVKNLFIYGDANPDTNRGHTTRI